MNPQHTELTSIGYKITSMEDLKEQVPAAFATSYHPERSERYSLFSTAEFLDTLSKLGWTPYSAKQQGTGPYARHIIRLQNPDLGYIPVKGDKIKPHLMIDNSHNGFTKGQIHMGLFRLVCTNGLVVGIPGLHSSIKFKHMGLDQAQIMNLIAETSEQYRTIGSHIEDMQQIIMSEDDKLEFAVSALALREPNRFIKADKTADFDTIVKLMDPKDIYKPVRPQDEANDLWTVFNVVQERTINGLYERKTERGYKGSPKMITNVARHLTYNQKLWTLAEDYMPKESLVTV
jgi:hypothetical protein